MDAHDRHQDADPPDEGIGPDLHLLGVSFRNAPRAVQAALQLDDLAAHRALMVARQLLPGGEALVVATPDRTELYAVGPTAAAVLGWHRHVLPGRVLPTAECPAADAYRYHRTGRSAARHLFRMVAGLDSPISGADLVAEVQAAARRSDELGLLGSRLRLAVDHALQTGREVQDERSAPAGTSIGGAVADLVASTGAPHRRVTVLGAGEAAASVVRALGERDDRELRIVNRTLSRAVALAERHRARATSLDGLTWSLLVADVVVAATSAPGPVVTPAVVAEVRTHEPSWSPLVVDLGLPRNVDPACGLRVVDLEALSDRSRRAGPPGGAAVEAAERRVEDGLVRWNVLELRRRIRHRLGQLGVLDAAS